MLDLVHLEGQHLVAFNNVLIQMLFLSYLLHPQGISIQVKEGYYNILLDGGALQPVFNCVFKKVDVFVSIIVASTFGIPKPEKSQELFKRQRHQLIGIGVSSILLYHSGLDVVDHFFREWTVILQMTQEVIQSLLWEQVQPHILLFPIFDKHIKVEGLGTEVFELLDVFKGLELLSDFVVSLSGKDGEDSIQTLCKEKLVWLAD